MEVEYRSRSLARRGADEREAAKASGVSVARKYIQRLQIIAAAPTWEALRSYRALGLHPLKGTRRGEYAMTLTGRWRLIVRPEGETVWIEEVSQHYGD